MEKMISFDCMYCHQASHKYLLPRVWRKVCFLADTNKFKVPCLIPASQVRFVTELQSTNTRGQGQIVDTLPPLTGNGGWGLPVFVTKINKWSAQTRQTDRTVEEWIKHSSSGWQPGGYLIFVVIYSHSSLSGWLYLPDPESPVRSQAGNTFLRLLLTEICLTSILDTFKNRIKTRIMETLRRYLAHPFGSSPAKPNILKCPQHN